MPKVRLRPSMRINSRHSGDVYKGTTREQLGVCASCSHEQEDTTKTCSAWVYGTWLTFVISRFDLLEDRSGEP